MEISILDDTYCQLCERLITKEQGNKHLSSGIHLHKKAFAYILYRKLTGIEGSILEKSFWKKIFATIDITEVDEFLITYFMMVKNLN